VADEKPPAAGTPAAHWGTINLEGRDFMKALRRALTVTVTIAAGAIAVGLVLPASATSAPDRGYTLEFGVNFRPFQDNYVDIGETGFTVGDLLVFQDDLLDGAGNAAGIQGGTCTITAFLPGGLQTHCVGTASLSDGQISFQGLATDAPVKPLAVTGGTGKYDAATGEVTLTEHGDGTGTLSFRLTRGPR
jgi:allene oxide cyclase